MEQWKEFDSQRFIDYGDYFIPFRETQMEIICDLVASVNPKKVVDLCCGEGKLSKRLLSRIKELELVGYDLSAAMLLMASSNLKNFEAQFQARKFQLEERDWRNELSADVVVSSLGLHHLNDDEKRELYKDVYHKISPGGMLVVADLIKPTTEIGWQIGAKLWNEYVFKMSEMKGLETLEAFENERWNYYQYPDDPVDKPSTLYEQLRWLYDAGFVNVDVFWMYAGHAVFGGYKQIQT
ncbi:MAG: class I SAM-dependent methyltransferase [Candidatus Kapaibacterium sp.]